MIAAACSFVIRHVLAPPCYEAGCQDLLCRSLLPDSAYIGGFACAHVAGPLPVVGCTLCVSIHNITCHLCCFQLNRCSLHAQSKTIIQQAQDVFGEFLAPLAYCADASIAAAAHPEQLHAFVMLP